MTIQSNTYELRAWMQELLSYRAPEEAVLMGTVLEESQRKSSFLRQEHWQGLWLCQRAGQ